MAYGATLGWLVAHGWLERPPPSHSRRPDTWTHCLRAQGRLCGLFPWYLDPESHNVHLLPGSPRLTLGARPRLLGPRCVPEVALGHLPKNSGKQDRVSSVLLFSLEHWPHWTGLGHLEPVIRGLKELSKKEKLQPLRALSGAA